MEARELKACGFWAPGGDARREVACAPMALPYCVAAEAASDAVRRTRRTAEQTAWTGRASRDENRPASQLASRSASRVELRDGLLLQLK